MRNTGRAGACKPMILWLKNSKLYIGAGVLGAAILGGFAAPLAHSVPRPADAAKSPAGETVRLADLTARVNDLQATVHMLKCDAAELEKIGTDFRRTNELQNLVHDITLQYKQPDKMRLAGGSKFFQISIVYNGPMRVSRVPTQRTRTEDLSDSPGKRQSLLEYGGLLAPSTLSFMQGKFVRQDILDGQPAVVFDLTYKGVTGGSHYRVWFDPRTRLTVKREWYGFEGKLKATFLYQDPKEVAEGIWLPTQVEVKNAEGVSAAITTIDNVKVNQGLSDDVFAIAR